MHCSSVRSLRASSYLTVGQVKEARQEDDIKYVDSHVSGYLDVALSSELFKQLVNVNAPNLR